ncbi:MAG: nitroreductase [Pseudomonadota bacterium]
MSEQADVLKSLMQARYSCRAILPEQVPQQVINEILDTARHTASWNNTQPWQVLITRGDETDRFREALVDEFHNGKPGPDFPWPESYPDELGERRRTCGYALYNAVGIERKDYDARNRQSLRNFELFDAPHVAILHTPAALGTYGAVDTGGFLTAFMLAATAHELGSIAQAAVAAYPRFIRSHFGLPENRLILCAISFGYPDKTDPVNNYRTDREEIDAFSDFKD